LNDPPADAFPLITGKMDYQQENYVIRGEKNVDKIRPFQIDERSLPEKIHESKKRKSGRRDTLSSP